MGAIQIDYDVGRSVGMVRVEDKGELLEYERDDNARAFHSYVL